MFYENKKDLLQDICDELVTDSEEKLIDFFNAKSIKDQNVFLISTYKYFYKNIKKYMTIIDINEDGLFFYDIYEQAVRKICICSLKDNNIDVSDNLHNLLFCEWFTASLMATLKACLKYNITDFDTLANDITMCINYGLFSVIH